MDRSEYPVLIDSEIHSSQPNPVAGLDSRTPAPPARPPAAVEEETAQTTELGWSAVLKDLLETVILTLIIFLLIRTVVQNFKVDGMSMEPNFHNGQFLLVSKLSYRLGEPQRGDVIVFRYPRDPARDFIKRVVGLPGETVEIRNGQVFINGAPMSELAAITPAHYTVRPTTLGPDELYVLGDNRPNSSDSHSWGPLPMNMVIGKVILSYWPPDTWGLVKTATAGNQARSGLGEVP